MVVVHVCPLEDDPCNGVLVVVPALVKAQRQYIDAAVWNVGQPFHIDGLEQVFTANAPEELPPPYNRPDLVVFHELYITCYLKIAKALQRAGIPYIVVPHSSLNRAAQKKSRLKKAVANCLLFKPLCRRAVGIQYLTEFEKNESIIKKGAFVSHNGIAAPAQTKAAFHTDEIRFAYIGRISPYIKGLDLMVQAFGLEKDFLAAHHCSLHIYGPTDDRGYSYASEMRTLTEQSGAQELITLHDAVFGEEKLRVLLDTDVFIQTSRSDGMPMGVLEALSCGLPCLVTEGTTLAKKISAENAGWDGGTTAATIAKALRRAVSDRESYAAISDNALRIGKEYNWDSAAQTAIAHYQDLLKER